MKRTELEEGRWDGRVLGLFDKQPGDPTAGLEGATQPPP